MGKVGLITGGASGIGLATAKVLAGKGWTIAIADLNVAAGESVAQELKGSFHKTNVSNYESLSETFAQVWAKYGRLDFVFANAGIVEKGTFYERHQSNAKGLPPPPDLAVLDINLGSVTSTTHLAQHFFRQNSPPGGALVITASSGGLYAIPNLPLYAAAKHGCVGFCYSVASVLAKEGVRVNAICPSSVRTGLLAKEDWDKFPEGTFTAVEKVADVVVHLVEDEAMVGRTVEIVQDRTYYRTAPEPTDGALKSVMDGTQPIRKSSKEA